AKVSFTTALYVSPVQMMPACDHTGTPNIEFDGFLHFTSSTTSGSASWMSPRRRASVSPRQSPRSLILCNFGAVFRDLIAFLATGAWRWPSLRPSPTSWASCRPLRSLHCRVEIGPQVCPLLALSRHATGADECLLSGVKRT